MSVLDINSNIILILSLYNIKNKTLLQIFTNIILC